MGLRPYLSLKPPTMGANKNWKKAYENNNQPPYLDATLKPSPVSSMIKLGITGMMIPIPVMSISRVTKINPTAAFLDFMSNSILVL